MRWRLPLRRVLSCGFSAETHGVIDLIPSEGIPSDSGGMEWSVLGLVIFRNGEPEPELLGCVHPHGSHLDWRLT